MCHLTLSSMSLKHDLNKFSLCDAVEMNKRPAASDSCFPGSFSLALEQAGYRTVAHETLVCSESSVLLGVHSL